MEDMTELSFQIIVGMLKNNPKLKRRVRALMKNY